MVVNRKALIPPVMRVGLSFIWKNSLSDCSGVKEWNETDWQNILNEKMLQDREICKDKEQEDEKMNYRLGLDIGIASVGWAVVRTDSKDEPCGIERMGVRVFDKAEVPKTGDSLASARRSARCTRRRLRRRRHRIERTEILLENAGLIDRNLFQERYQSGQMENVYELRVRALDELISDEGLAQILVFMVKHRGFKSTRRAEMKDDETGKVLSAVKENERRMKEQGYRTVGEMIYLDESFRKDAPWSDTHYLLTPRNKGGDYRHTIFRAQLEEEVLLILDTQKALGNDKITEEFIEKYKFIFEGQRSFDEGPGLQSDHQTPSPYAGSLIENMVGNCTFEKDEKRAAKATYTAQRFMLLEKINHTTIVCDGVERRLSDAERQALKEYAYQKEKLTYEDVRKKLKLSDDAFFKSLVYQKNKAETEKKTKYVSLDEYHKFKKASIRFVDSIEINQNYELYDQVATILSYYKGDERRMDELSTLGIPMDICGELLELSPSKFQHLSVKAMQNILPYLEEGQIYSDACTAAGYDFRNDGEREKQKYLTQEVVQEMLADIPNPVVCRAISQTVKVVNAIIREYGSPVAVHIELAREMAKNFKERNELTKSMEQNMKKNESVKKRLHEEYGVINPTGQDIVKFKLWEEQDGRCMYSGDAISIEHLFAPGYAEVDHIIPYSISFDDSYRNKVLVKKQYNQEKGNRTPYEYFGQNESWWKKYENLVQTCVKDFRKQQHLLKKHVSKEEREEFKVRNIQDTKYITSAMQNLIRQNLLMAPYETPDKKRKMFTVNGTVTDYLKKRWGLPKKDRRTDKHHAMDALVVACTTQGMIQKISQTIQAREIAGAKECVLFDENTGEIFERHLYSNDEWDELFGVRIPLPWNLFRLETAAFMAEDPSFEEDQEERCNSGKDIFGERKELLVKELIRQGYRKNEEQQEIVIPSIFVSRMPRHKVTGAGHEDTIRSARHFDEEGMVVKKTSLDALKLDKDGEIKDYYDKESDWLLYNALKKRLQEYGGDGKKAFPVGEDFHKPKADGTDGPVVKKVKLISKQSLGVKVNGGAGICSNGSMIRIDLFRENGKYYYVPVYTADAIKKELPMKAATAAKPYEKWKVMKEENFLFSIYPGDLIEIQAAKGKTIPVTTVDKEKREKQTIKAYFNGADISSASISGESHDRTFSFRGLGVQSLDSIKKFQVDILGNYHEVKKEVRRDFSKRKMSKIRK